MLQDIIIDKLGTIPDTLIILGSGINDFVKQLTDKESLSYKALFDIDSDASIGHAGYLHLGYLHSIPILVMEGRKHYYEGVNDDEMRFLLQSFAAVGVKNLIVTNACGGMNESFQPGDIMLIEDHINMMGRNPLVGRNNDQLGERFVDMTEPYDIEFREIIKDIAYQEDVPLQKGIYVSYLGPSYETKAEIRAFRMLGGDAVGMSTVPEVIIARHAGMRVLGLSIITNMSTGLSQNKLSHNEVLEMGRQALERLSILLVEFVERISNHEGL